MSKKKKYQLREVHNVCIYARFSQGSRQTEKSIEGQLQVCREYAEAHAYTVVHVYKDSRSSGTNDDRAQFRQMLQDSDRRIFDAVLVWKCDRFGRNMEEQVLNEVRLKNNGVSLISVTEPVAEGPLGQMQKAMLMGMAEFYSATNSENVTRGMRQAAMNCQVLSGAIPFGYKKGSDKKFALDEPAAAMVREIFQRYDGGEKIFHIMDDCNLRGFRTVQRQAPFTHNTMYSILTNERYTGVYIWKDIRVEGGMPPIIDKELYERVRQKMEKNKKAPARAKANVPFLFTTKCFCGLCGGPMIGDSGTGKNGTTHHYYSCANRKNARDKRTACPKKSIRKDLLEEMVLQRTLAEVLQPGASLSIAQQLVAYQQNDRTGTQLAQLQQRQHAVEKAIANLLDVAEAGQLTDSLSARLAQREEDLVKIKAATAELHAERPTLTEAQIIHYLDSFAGGDLNDPAYSQRLVDIFINSVFVYPDELVVCYNFSAAHTHISLSALNEALAAAQKVEPSAEKEKAPVTEGFSSASDSSDNAGLVHHPLQNPNILFTPTFFALRLPFDTS